LLLSAIAMGTYTSSHLFAHILGAMSGGILPNQLGIAPVTARVSSPLAK
jgi:hypothetical protein